MATLLLFKNGEVLHLQQKLNWHCFYHVFTSFRISFQFSRSRFVSRRHVGYLISWSSFEKYLANMSVFPNSFSLFFFVFVCPVDVNFHKVYRQNNRIILFYGKEIRISYLFPILSAIVLDNDLVVSLFFVHSNSCSLVFSSIKSKNIPFRWYVLHFWEVFRHDSRRNSQLSKNYERENRIFDLDSNSVEKLFQGVLLYFTFTGDLNDLI